MTSKRFQARIKELFIRCRKLNTSLVYITQSYFGVPKEIKFNQIKFYTLSNNENS